MTITLTDWQRRELVRMDKPTDTLESFLIGRAEWLEVVTSEVSPHWFDILLKIDGSYAGSDQADEIAESFRSELREIVGKTIERHQPAETTSLPMTSAATIGALDNNITEALASLPLGRAEEDVRAAAFYIFRRNGPTDQEVAAWQDAFDDVLHDLIREDVILQRVIGGRVRMVHAEYGSAEGAA